MEESAKGNCFIVALQMIHDFSTADDPLLEILEQQQIDPKTLDFSQLFLVHGLGKVRSFDDANKEKEGTHAWIELDGNAIDYANGRKDFLSAPLYYASRQIQPAIRLCRQQVLSLILSDPSLENGFYWGDYTEERLDQIRRAYDASTYQDWNRNFLLEYEKYQIRLEDQA